VEVEVVPQPMVEVIPQAQVAQVAVEMVVQEPLIWTRMEKMEAINAEAVVVVALAM
jgi:ATP phosphoribosyltransferase